MRLKSTSCILPIFSDICLEQRPKYKSLVRYVFYSYHFYSNREINATKMGSDVREIVQASDRHAFDGSNFFV